MGNMAKRRTNLYDKFQVELVKFSDGSRRVWLVWFSSFRLCVNVKISLFPFLSHMCVCVCVCLYVCLYLGFLLPASHSIHIHLRLHPYNTLISIRILYYMYIILVGTYIHTVYLYIHKIIFLSYVGTYVRFL